ncbi:hypothetical protein CPHO_06270 [Corynebacterium phocae]|uniref:Uncharacterized protein n=1 Tax=Corynebacterium phocae TaxID=161895 RepID=A0A1L7D3R1_9CORY|nr:hypothetical protein CPHO_06270 [Corynebacterium phocae]
MVHLYPAIDLMSRREAAKATAQWMEEFYNRKRRHSSINILAREHAAGAGANAKAPGRSRASSDFPTAKKA